MSLDVKCPQYDQLETFANGKAAPADASRIQSHLNQCSSCRAAFLALLAPTTAIHGDRPSNIPSMGLSDDSVPPAPPRYSFLGPAVSGDEIGRLGDFRVLRLLGQGGMGFVFLAEDTNLARPVALKVLKPDSKDPESIQRFMREARMLASLKHENLVTVYQVGTQKDVAFFAMELLDGESLETRIRRPPPPDVAEIVRIAREVTEGLAFIHQKNLVHRDIKPANIWLEAPAGRVKILDLGLARPLDDESGLTMTGFIMGTPEFMSPEQARGQDIDARADLFSLGGLMYYLCTGQKPFQGSTSVAVLMALASETPPPPRELNPRLPEALSDLVMQLLAREPRLRPASADEVLRRLKSIQRGLGSPPSESRSQAPDTQVLAPSARPSRTSRGGLGVAGWLTLFVGFLLVGVVAPLLFWVFRSSLFPANDPNPPQPPVGETVFLIDMKDIARENWPFKIDPAKEMKKKGPKNGPFGKDMEGPIRHQGRVHPKGIFMHPPPPPDLGVPASLTYRLDKQFGRLHAEVSLRDGPPESETPCVFWVFGDGKQLWKSRPVSTQQDAQKCDISVKDVVELKIAVTCDGLPHGAHAIWIDPRLSK